MSPESPIELLLPDRGLWFLTHEGRPLRHSGKIQIRSILSTVELRFCSLLIKTDRWRTIGRMLAAERRRLIAESVRARGGVSVAEMAEWLATTEITSRRDLHAMAKDGWLVRTHGGAIRPSGVGHEPSYSEKAQQAAGEKAAIARLALDMIRPGDSIVLGPGTTTLALARLLVHSPELTVVTNSLLVAQALMEAPRVEVILTGGGLGRSLHAPVRTGAGAAGRALQAA